MENSDEQPIERKNGIMKSLKENTIITVLNLSNQGLKNISDIELPTYLTELNLSNNELRCVPAPVLDLKELKILNLSSNKIKYFDETPGFCHTLENLNLAHNELHGPPYWVWSESPKNLSELDISFNPYIKKSLDSAYISDLLQYKTLLSVVKICSCNWTSQYEVIETFANAKVLDFSTETLISANTFTEIPCKGLEKCCDIERLNLTYTRLCYINSNIDIFKNLVEINLSQNNICDLPEEFCNLKNLEICILSFNTIMYLPDGIIKLKNLTVLCVDSNKLCMLPEKMHELKKLMKLDIYDNYIYDIPEELDRFKEIDLAQNYFDEPEDDDYIEKRNKLRSELLDRLNGRKFEITRSESSHSSRSIDEEFCSDHNDTQFEQNDDTNRPLSSPEDWDSDDYWVPHFPRITTPPQSPWLFFIKRMMEEGNFCPIDAHPIPVIEEVRYEMLCNPQVFHECEGQFDDVSEDDS